MTPQEELFAKLFSNEAVLVSEMDTLQLRAHREELAITAFTARAKLSAVDAEEKRRKNKSSDGRSPTGFARSVNTDDTTTEAINTVKERQKRMSKIDKIREGLLKLPGMDTAEVDRIMSAGALIRQVRINEEKAKQNAEAEAAPKVVNPFAKKTEG